jgi:tRNA 2-thiocytidine biosynthesis protein TtcA
LIASGARQMRRTSPTARRLQSDLGRAVGDHELIAEGDRILVCLSGGKDSYTLLTLLDTLRSRAPVDFELIAFHLDQRQPGYPEGTMEEYLSSQNHPYRIVGENTYSVVVDKTKDGGTPCSICSRLRRGIIYRHAAELGCNKVALGHHRDDSIETLLLNLFHSGQIQAMPAKYTTQDGRFEVIRPLIYAAESEIRDFAEEQQYPIIPCNLCGSIAGRRNFVRSLLVDLETTIPDIRNNLLAALQNVRPSHLLDPSLLRGLIPQSANSPDSPGRDSVQNSPARIESKSTSQQRSTMS